jgi:23S rRNA U2552 (ribose-2'-O)-methylase RlmE/FtsJ
VIKFYKGPEDGKLERALKKIFKSVKRVKPNASRWESIEMYFVSKDKRKKKFEREELEELF